MKPIIVAGCLFVSVLPLFAAQDAASSQDAKPGAGSAAAITLPLTVDKVWFRTAKFRMGAAWEKTGKLTVTDSAIEFTHKNGTLRIARETVTEVGEGMLRPDASNTWIIVRYSENGDDRLAGFTTPPFSRGAQYQQLLAAITKLTAPADAP